MQYIVRLPNGQRWSVRQATSLKSALNCINYARATGSVGSSTTVDQRLCGGTVKVVADVVQINSDGTERQPYTVAY